MGAGRHFELPAFVLTTYVYDGRDGKPPEVRVQATTDGEGRPAPGASEADTMFLIERRGPDFRQALEAVLAEVERRLDLVPQGQLVMFGRESG